MGKMKAETLPLRYSKGKKLGYVWLKNELLGKVWQECWVNACGKKYCYKIHREYYWETTITESWAT